MDNFWDGIQLLPSFSEQGVSCYALKGKFNNKYYIISETETRKLMNQPEVVGYEVYKCLVHSTSQMLYYLKNKDLISRANILSILRGALNYPLEEACYNEHIKVHDISFLSSERVFTGTEITGLEIKYNKLAIVPDSTLMIGDIIASGVTLVKCLRFLLDAYKEKGTKLRNIIIFTIGGRKGITILEKLTEEIREYWPGFEGFITIYYEGIFNCYEEGDRGVSKINIADVDFYWKGGIIAPEFRRQTLSMEEPLFEKCTIYDGGARRYEIKEHINEVLEFWNHMKEHASEIDIRALTEEKLGHSLDLNYEQWLEDCHYEHIDKDTAHWLYVQEQGFIKSIEALSLRDLADRRIRKFTEVLRKYFI
ncbi:MAG: hypothetical protein HUK24_03690 [Sphaerochaetaceae bacterium]|nr:hypothetical protein [Sphaerochaetaceae bacterium]